MDNNHWEDVVSRRSQQFGRYYNQAKKWMDKHKYVPIPSYIDFLVERLQTLNLLEQGVEQWSWLVQEYKPGQGIHPHIDQFGVRVIGINMAAEAEMRMSRENEEVLVTLKRRALYVLSDDARYIWKHGILDVSKRRMSITVRDVSLNPDLVKK